jgi:protein-S-isoprenylcysteine O-methyltransferase Ste14
MLKALSIVGFLGMAGGVMAQLVTGNLFSASSGAIAVQLGALLVLVWGRVVFGRRSFHVAANPTEGGLVTSGPYRYIRHPIYTAFGVFSGAGVIAHWSWASGLLGGLVGGVRCCESSARKFWSRRVARSIGNTPPPLGG